MYCWAKRVGGIGGEGEICGGIFVAEGGLGFGLTVFIFLFCILKKLCKRLFELGFVHHHILIW